MRSVTIVPMQKSNGGFFLVIDGIDGSGKSTLATFVEATLRKQDIPTMRTTEPTHRELGKILRKYLQDVSSPAPLDALVFAADRIEHCNAEILPALEQNQIVISDRYRDSSYVYQTIQGEACGMDLDWVKTINKFSLEPDIVIILDLDPSIALARKHTQNQQNQTEMEKFENLAFQQKIRALFLEIAASQTNHIILDATKNPEELCREVIKIVKAEWNYFSEGDQ